MTYDTILTPSSGRATRTSRCWSTNVAQAQRWAGGGGTHDNACHSRHLALLPYRERTAKVLGNIFFCSCFLCNILIRGSQARRGRVRLESGVVLPPAAPVVQPSHCSIDVERNEWLPGYGSTAVRETRLNLARQDATRIPLIPSWWRRWAAFFAINSVFGLLGSLLPAESVGDVKSLLLVPVRGAGRGIP